MLPCLQALVEELGHLARVLVGNGIVVRGIGSRSGGKVLLCVGHFGCCLCDDGI